MLSNKEQKFIKSLKIKKYRLRERRFLVEGAKNVQELLNADYEVDLLVCTSEHFPEIEQKCGKIRVELVSENVLSQLGTFKTNDAVLAVVQIRDFGPVNYDSDEQLFVLDGVGDPGNLGTIIRTLDWFGFQRLLCSKDCAEFYHPKTIASTMGSFTRVQVQYGDLEEVLSKMDRPVYGADAGGVSIYDAEIPSNGVVVMGSESHGISPEIQKLVSQNIGIPKVGNAESLNVGIATGIIASYLRMSK